jgi:hypothetical protein
MSTIAAAAQTADRIDYWIRRHVISVLLRNASLSKPKQVQPARDRRVGLLAIGQCLKEQYDALMPRHLAALVQQLEMQRKGHDLGRTDVNRRTGWCIMYIQKRHWLDYDPVAFAALVIGIGMIELLALII